MAATAAVRLGHARSASKPLAEQVAITNWYASDSGGPWTMVQRFNDRNYAVTLAQLITEACNNDNIYYTQDLTLRRGVYNYAAQGIRPSQITQMCGCDCTSLIGGCCKYMGVDISVSYIRNNLMKTGLVTSLTDSIYTGSCTQLRVGDILTREHHAAVVVYSEYDSASTEYVNIPDTNSQAYVRNQQWGRYQDIAETATEEEKRKALVSVPFLFTERDGTPKKPQDWSHIECFMFGAALVGCTAKFSDKEAFSNIGIIRT